MAKPATESPFVNLHPAHAMSKLATVLITIQCPRQIRVRVPAGRDAAKTILRALTKAQERIIVTGTLA